MYAISHVLLVMYYRVKGLFVLCILDYQAF
jgi:hypothetical protein